MKRFAWLIVAVGCAYGVVAAAQSPPLVPSAPRGGVEPPPVVSERQPEDVDLAAALAQMARELAALRQEVARLQQSMETHLRMMTLDLREENARLKDLLDYAADHPGILHDLGVDSIGVEDPWFAEEDEPIRIAPSDSEEEPLADSGYTIVKEWGRSPEMVAQLNTDVSTLKGMVIAVSPLSNSNDLIELGYELRDEFAEYDNLNIEVYNDVRAARLFADTGVGDPDHRVLSISKFAASGRDVILLIRGDEVTIVP